jgi:hypothetical protein
LNFKMLLVNSVARCLEFRILGRIRNSPAAASTRRERRIFPTGSFQFGLQVTGFFS